MRRGGRAKQDQRDHTSNVRYTTTFTELHRLDGPMRDSAYSMTLWSSARYKMDVVHETGRFASSPTPHNLSTS